jgi:hypothetical protein
MPLDGDRVPAGQGVHIIFGGTHEATDRLAYTKPSHYGPRGRMNAASERSERASMREAPPVASMPIP